MRRLLIMAGLLALLPLGAAFAQEATPAIPSVNVTVGEKPYTLPLKADELGILYLDQVIVTNDGQYANALVWVQTLDGWRQMVPCSDGMIACTRVPIRVEGGYQGQSFVFREWTGPGSAPPIEGDK